MARPPRHRQSLWRSAMAHGSPAQRPTRARICAGTARPRGPPCLRTCSAPPRMIMLCQELWRARPRNP
eukprot:11526065-Alexandrium_andersonii.AAC.1